MSDADWCALLDAYVDGHLTHGQFHDRFFEAWNALSRNGFAEPPPQPVETLFYVVEAYCPDPALRDPNSAYEASDAELQQAARDCLARLRQAGPLRSVT